MNALIEEARQTTETTVNKDDMRSFVLPDGTRLRYRAWLPEATATRAVVLLHRGHEHSGRLIELADALRQEQTAIFAWDARGHGRSDGPRGDAPSFATLAADLDAFVRYLEERHGVVQEDMVVLGHSVAAVTAAAWAHDYAPRVRGLVLATPAFRVKLYVPFAIPGLRLLQRLRKGRPTYVKSYVKSRMLTHDPEQAAAYDADPLIEKGISVRVLLGLYDTSTRIVEDAANIPLPCLVLSGGKDWVVREDVQQRFFARLPHPHKRWRRFAGMHHDILHETGREEVFAEIRSFVDDLFTSPPAELPLVDADRVGATQVEYEGLRQPLPRCSPKRLCFAAQSLAMASLGRLSKGIRLGYRTGFDSGRSLDYVYANQAQGALGIGKIIDKVYLDSAGWRGIRTRRVHMQQALDEALDRLVDAGQTPRILDLATGAGRYVLDVLEQRQGLGIRACLRDNVEGNLEQGRELARDMGIEGVDFELGDAFDADQVATTSPAPNLGVVSGLYELFPDNTGVRRSLAGMANALRKGAEASGEAYLVYTGQPWHPQLEMIARTLPNRDQQPWVMRRRSQAELDALVREAGFEKIGTRIDADGIFTVSLARLRSETDA